MNAKRARQVLNAAFKQFQRLPEWPAEKRSGADRPAEEGSDKKAQGLLQPDGLRDAFILQTLVE